MQSHIFTVKYTKYGPKTAEWRRWSERKQQQSQAYVMNNQQHPNNHWHKHKKCSYLNIRILFLILEFKHFHFIFVQSSTLPAQACVHSFVASHTCGLKCVFVFAKFIGKFVALRSSHRVPFSFSSINMSPSQMFLSLIELCAFSSLSSETVLRHSCADTARKLSYFFSYI